MALRVKRNCGRSWGFVSWLPVVIDFGYLRWNRHWWHNLHARFAIVYRLHYGHWPTYWYWRHPERCEACEVPADRFNPRSHSRTCPAAVSDGAA